MHKCILFVVYTIAIWFVLSRLEDFELDSDGLFGSAASYGSLYALYCWSLVLWVLLFVFLLSILAFILLNNVLIGFDFCGLLSSSYALGESIEA